VPEPTELHSCPRLTSAFELFGKRWNAVIIDVLLQRPARFAELSRAVSGLSQRVLSERLRELADAGLLERRVGTGSPITVTYSLTPRGESLAPAMQAMREWAAAGSAEAEEGPEPMTGSAEAEVRPGSMTG
jgi:DNA-binding HxlR family transcriptional regulator